MGRNVVIGIILLVVTFIILVTVVQPARAVPEYASQFDEPCGSCHISPAGGGLRTPRGLGWVSLGKLGAVPSLEEALEILGVSLEADPADFVADKAKEWPQAAPLQYRPEESEALETLLEQLLDYEGN